MYTFKMDKILTQLIHHAGDKRGEVLGGFCTRSVCVRESQGYSNLQITGGSWQCEQVQNPPSHHAYILSGYNVTSALV